jgi:mannose-6-phosphate isomerase-like protein (cupin superfamily)
MPKILSFDEIRSSETASLFEGRDHGTAVSFFIVRTPPGRGPRLHRHPYPETFVVEQGSATFTVDGETIEAYAGQIVVVPAGAAHKFVSSGPGPLHQLGIHASDRVIQEDLDE